MRISNNKTKSGRINCSKFIIVILFVLVIVVCVILSAELHADDIAYIRDSSTIKSENSLLSLNNVKVKRKTENIDRSLKTTSLVTTASLSSSSSSSSQHLNTKTSGDNDWIQHYTSKYLRQFQDSLSFQDMDLREILNNDTKLINFNPFDVNFGINVWDLYPPEITCPDIKRFGRAGEGGKWICGYSTFLQDKHVKSNHCIMYSFGLSYETSFEEEMLLRTNCEIFAFDPSIGRLPSEPLRANLTQWEQLKDSRIHFHKMAIGPTSGSSNQHSLTVSIFDIMHKYKHSYIDILKVDIESSEWQLFENLFMDQHIQRKGKANHRLPIGQLIIELHYESMTKINSFFTRIKENGFYPFSREINLQPAIAGNDPFACEYSFINPNNVVLHHKIQSYYDTETQSSVALANAFTVPEPKTPSWHQPIKGIIYILTQSSRFDLLAYTLSKFYQNVWKQYPFYPVIIFHDDLTEKQQIKLQEIIPNLNLLTFLKIQLVLPPNSRAEDIPTRTKCAPKTSTLGYRHMCYFHATYVHSIIFNMTEYKDVEYLLRLDDG